MQQEIANPLLNEAEQKIEGQILPANRQDYLKIVVGGMHAAMANGPNGILASLQRSKDPVADAARGAVSMVLILRHETQKAGRGDMPLQAMVPAAMTLMLKALDFVDRAGMVKVGNDELVRATHVFTNTIFRAFRITPQMLATATAKVHALTQDPQAMQAINMRAGVLAHPNAAKVPMPGGA